MRIAEGAGAQVAICSEVDAGKILRKDFPPPAGRLEAPPETGIAATRAGEGLAVVQTRFTIQTA